MNLPNRKPLGTFPLPAHPHHIREAARSRPLGKVLVLERLQPDALEPLWDADVEIRVVELVVDVVERCLGEQDDLDVLVPRERVLNRVSEVEQDAAVRPTAVGDVQRGLVLLAELDVSSPRVTSVPE
jgi:hypothetical protein